MHSSPKTHSGGTRHWVSWGQKTANIQEGSWLPVVWVFLLWCVKPGGQKKKKSKRSAYRQSRHLPLSQMSLSLLDKSCSFVASDQPTKPVSLTGIPYSPVTWTSFSSCPFDVLHASWPPHYSFSGPLTHFQMTRTYSADPSMNQARIVLSPLSVSCWEPLMNEAIDVNLRNKCSWK